MIKHFTIFGERCSGTNYLQSLVEKNFALTPTWKFGWKHFFGFHNMRISSDVLFIGIVRDPLSWLTSFFSNPYHLPDHIKAGWRQFLTTQWQSRLRGREIMEDRHLQSKRRYRNVFELRSVKALYLLDQMPKLVPNFVLLRMEDLQVDPLGTLQKLEDKFKLVRKQATLMNEISYKGEKKTAFVHQKRDIPPEVLQLVFNNIDWQTEKKLGYYTPPGILIQAAPVMPVRVLYKKPKLKLKQEKVASGRRYLGKKREYN